MSDDAELRKRAKELVTNMLLSNELDTAQNIIDALVAFAAAEFQRGRERGRNDTVTTKPHELNLQTK